MSLAERAAQVPGFRERAELVVPAPACRRDEARAAALGQVAESWVNSVERRKTEEGLCSMCAWTIS